MHITDFAPYVSLLVTKLRSGASRESILSECLDSFEDLLDLHNDEGIRFFEARGEPQKDASLWVAWIHYTEQRPPRWYTGDDNELLDIVNHLALFCRRDRYIAIHTSDSSVKRLVRRQLGGEEIHGLSGLQPIPRGVLNATYVEGPAKTLWLSGIHRSTSSKADSKILSGPNLRDALSPLGDQTYYFTAARSVNSLPTLPASKSEIAIGVAPDKSSIWTGPIRSWPEFRTRAYALLGILKQRDGANENVAAPLPVLALPAQDVAEIADPYGVVVANPELLTAEQLDAESREVAERWAFHARFDIVSSDGASFQADVEVQDNPLGRYSFDIDVEQDGKASIEVTCESDEENEFTAEAAKVLSRPSWIKVFYDSGHALADGRLFSMRFRDVEFDNWHFAQLGDQFNVKKEKPGQGSQFDVDGIGADGDRSLFSWVQRYWPPSTHYFGNRGPQTGFLCSDDGGGEIADFIHFDPTLRDGRGLLTLIHVKASGSDSAARGVSNSDYEVVTGQAVKNLRSLDRRNLADELEVGAHKQVARASWKDGVLLGNRDELVAALRQPGVQYDRLVVIVQPRVTKRAYDDIRNELDEIRRGAADESAFARRMRQLDTLLEGARADCRALGADLWVIGDDPGTM